MKSAKSWVSLIDSVTTEQLVKQIQRDALIHAANLCIESPCGIPSDWDYSDGNTQVMIRDRILKAAKDL